MPKKYQYEPDNFNTLTSVVEYKKEAVIEKVCLADTLFFYDTCSLRYHAKLQTPKSIADFIKEHNGVVILPRIILMELSSAEDNGSCNLHNADINYLKMLKNEGISIVIFDEEWIRDCLAFAFDENLAQRNTRFVDTMRNYGNTLTCVQRCAQRQSTEEKKRLYGTADSSKDLIAPFMLKLRDTKQEGDSLGEEIIYLLIVLLMNQGAEMYILSDDRSARTKYSKLQEILKSNGCTGLKGQICTQAFATTMLQRGRITYEEAKELILCAQREGQACNYTYIDMKCFDVKTDRFTTDQILDKMQKDSVFKIFY